MGEGRHVFVSVAKPGLMAAQSAAAGISLRGHQEEALEATVRDLTPRPGQPASPGGLRVTVQMATGSGKVVRRGRSRAEAGTARDGAGRCADAGPAGADDRLVAGGRPFGGHARRLLADGLRASLRGEGNDQPADDRHVAGPGGRPPPAHHPVRHLHLGRRGGRRLRLRGRAEGRAAAPAGAPGGR